MIEGRPRQSLVLYENPIEITGGMDPNDPFKKSFGGKYCSLEPPTLEEVFNEEIAFIMDISSTEG